MTRTTNKKLKIFIMSWLGISLISWVILAKDDALLGIEDTSETLYEAKFSDPTNLWNDINNIYAKNLNNAITVYMRPKIASQIYDTSRRLDSSKYNQTSTDTSPILWWEDIQINSNNVTIIWWKNITIQWNNENASILWISNWEVWIGDSHSTTPAILIWWESNSIWKNQEWNAIIWWKQNIIADTTQDTHILWWQNNENSTDSAIIAGINIKNAQAWKSFIYSDTSDHFIPSSSNSFYLNTKNWLGINKAIVASWGWVESAWTINVWTINIDSTLCTTDNIWLFWYFHQCLVWCTTWSSNNGGKRNLMDAHTGCVDMCNTTYSWKCIAPDPIIIPATGSVCIWGRFDNSKRCNEDLKNNIISKTLDIKFNTEFVSVCPDSLDKVANPCLYTCVDGAHEIDGACKRDCNFDWVALKHGETVTGYKHSIETCSGQCNNNVKLLKCDDGTLRIQPSNDPNNGTYTVRSCTTTWNSLPCEGFNLTKDQIDQHLTGHNYLTCTWYTVDGPTCKPYNKYKLNPTNPCQNWWTYQSDLWYCTKNCTRNGINYSRWQHVTWWNAAEVTCTSTSSTCTAKQLTCQEDGSWGTDETTYPYTQCNLIWETCINHTLTSCPQNGYCSECFSYTTNSSYQCLSWTTHYRLDGCKNGYTLINNKCEPECSLPRWEKIKYGETRKWYKKSAATCNETCEANSITYKCEANWVLQWGDIAVYTNKECVVHDVTCESNFNLTGKFSHWKFDTCTWYTTDWTSCTQFLAYDLTGCNDLYTYTWDNCIAKCRLPWDTGKDASTLVDHGTKTWAYLAISETCGEKCTSVYTWIVCSGGNRYYQSNPTTKANTWAGWYKFKSCEQKVPNCTIYTKSNSGLYITFSGLSQPIISHATLAGSPCLDYTYQTWTDTCLHNFTNYTFKCDSSYAWNNGWSACTRCQQNNNNTNLPAHAVRNNTNQPNTITTWTYDSNTSSSTACSYHCDSHSKRDWTKCAGDCLLKNANWSEAWYKHDSHVTWYTQTTYQCTTDSTTCQSASLTCDNGQWKNNAWEVVTQYIYNTGHTTNKTIAKTNSNPRRTLDHIEAHTTSQVNLWTEYFTDNSCGCTKWKTRYKQQCETGYTRWSDDKCHKQCTLTRSDGTTKTLNNWESQSVATSASVLCPNSCTYETRTCNEWTLSWTWIYKSCSRIWVTNNDYTQKNSCPSHCKCDGPVTDYANSTCTASTWFKITGAESSQYYRTGWNTCPAVCTPTRSNPCATGTADWTYYSWGYTCSYGSYSANCTCPDGKIRNDLFCDTPEELCLDTHNNCITGATSYDLTDTSDQYRWKCTLGSFEKICYEEIDRHDIYITETLHTEHQSTYLSQYGNCEVDIVYYTYTSDAAVAHDLEILKPWTIYRRDNSSAWYDSDTSSIGTLFEQWLKTAESTKSTPLKLTCWSTVVYRWEDTNGCIFKNNGIGSITIGNYRYHLMPAPCIAWIWDGTICKGRDYECYWDYPQWATLSTIVPESNYMSRRESDYIDSEACTFKCPEWTIYNSSNNTCIADFTPTPVVNPTVCPNASEQQNCEEWQSWINWTRNDSTCSCDCPSWSHATSDNHCETCTNINEKQNCEVWQGWSAKWTRNDSTCSCDCPSWTHTSSSNHCEYDNPTPSCVIWTMVPERAEIMWEQFIYSDSAPAESPSLNGLCLSYYPDYEYCIYEKNAYQPQPPRCECYPCEDDKIENTCLWIEPTSYWTKSSKSPSNSSTYWKCDSSGTAACTYTCPSWYYCSNWTCSASEGWWGWAGGWCFIAWTKIIMSDWTAKPIEEVQVWDQLLGANWINTVISLYRPLLWDQTLRSINWSTALMSETHPFNTTEWWKSMNPKATAPFIDQPVSQLKVWDLLITQDWYEKIINLAWMCAPADTQLYNFILDGDHTYYAEWISVHNSSAIQSYQKDVLNENTLEDNISDPSDCYFYQDAQGRHGGCNGNNLM